MFCKYCGAKIQENTVFCPECGRKQNTGTQPDAKGIEGAGVNPAPVAAQPQRTGTQTNSPKSLKIVWYSEASKFVPYKVILNGSEIGEIKCGYELNCKIYSNQVHLVFVPKCPKFFAWTVLYVDGLAVEDKINITLRVQYLSVMDSNNQLHVQYAVGIANLVQKNIKRKEYDKLQI